MIDSDQGHPCPEIVIYQGKRITYPKSQVADICLRRLIASCFKGSIYRDVATERRRVYCLCNKLLMRQGDIFCFGSSGFII